MPRNISENSLYVENALQHAFLSRLCQLVWVDESFPLLEVSAAEIDNQGYDVVLSVGGVTRHVQLKSTRLGGAKSRVEINLRLAEKPSGCVVWYEYDPTTLGICHYHFFGGKPGERLPCLDSFSVAKKSRANAHGVKTPRRSARLVPKARFESDLSEKDLVARLFGTL